MLLVLAGAIVGGTSVVLARHAWPRLRHLGGPVAARLSSVALASLGATSPRPLVLGLTGSIGMGKSTASEWWRRAGIRVHDSDATVHALYAAGGAAVAPIGRAFPGVVVDGGIDRAELSKAIAVAGREQSFKTLEQIVHPLVSASRAAFVAEAEAAGEWLVVVDVPLLLETNPDEASLRAAGVDAVLVMSAPEDVQVARVLARPGMTREKLQVILARQTPDATKRARADFVVTTEAFSPARAGLAQCLDSLAQQHARRWNRWLLSAGGGGGGGAGAAVRCVTFDLDDTLFPLMPPLLRASAALIDELLPRHLPRSAAAGACTKESLGVAMRAMGQAQPLLAHDLTELRRLSLLELAAAHGDPAEAVADLMAAFVAIRSDVGFAVYDDVAPHCTLLRASGLTVGSLTNGNCDVAQSGCAFGALFDFSLTAADAGAEKPGLAPFLHAAAVAGVHPCAVVHVGDSIRSDLLGALGCGMRAILLSRKDFARSAADEAAGRPPVDDARWREVCDLDEAAAVLREWGAL